VESSNLPVLNRTSRGHFLECASPSTLLDHERGHGNKIFKDEQHLFTPDRGAEITEQKREISSLD
jgi:hypothetical protein